MKNENAINKRISKLEQTAKGFMREGIMPDSEKKFFDSRKELVLCSRAMKMKFKENRAPTMADFSEKDQEYMRNYIRAKFPYFPFQEMYRRTFRMVELGDLSVDNEPLENFVSPIGCDVQG